MPAGTGLALDYDGVGVAQPWNNDADEITLNRDEQLAVTFANPADVVRLDFLDLFAWNPNNPRAGATGPETIRVDFYASAAGSKTDSKTFTGTDLNPPGENGYLTASFGAIKAQKLVFYMDPQSQRDDRTADAAVAAVGVTAMPVPAAVWLFGSALLGIAGIGYRRTA